MMYRARIHIERVIGRLKDVEIMKGTLPINLVKRKVDSGIISGDKLVRVVMYSHYQHQWTYFMSRFVICKVQDKIHDEIMNVLDFLAGLC